MLNLHPASAPIPLAGSNLPRCLSMKPVMHPRILKIEETGDFYASTVRPKIRLAGRWLERAGFKPGHRVQVEWVEDGVLSLRFIEIAKPTE
jgi:hypothetical protein